MKFTILCLVIVLPILINGVPTNRQQKPRNYACKDDDGNVIKLGEQHWKNGCQLCICTKYGLLCAPVDCFGIECFDSVHLKGECCPSCPYGPNCGAYHGDDQIKIISVGSEEEVEGDICGCVEDTSGYGWFKYASECREK